MEDKNIENNTRIREDELVAHELLRLQKELVDRAESKEIYHSTFSLKGIDLSLCDKHTFDSLCELFEEESDGSVEITVDLRNTHLHELDDDKLAVISIIIGHESVTAVSLANNHLSELMKPAHQEILFQFFDDNTHLSSLDLSGNDLGKMGNEFDAFFKHVGKLKSLETLNLAGNTLSALAEHCLSTLTKHEKLIDLDLSMNGFSDHTLTTTTNLLIRLRPLSMLRRLSLARNPLPDTKDTYIMWRLCLGDLTHLHDLDLTETGLIHFVDQLKRVAVEGRSIVDYDALKVSVSPVPRAPIEARGHAALIGRVTTGSEHETSASVAAPARVSA